MYFLSKVVLLSVIAFISVASQALKEEDAPTAAAIPSKEILFTVEHALTFGAPFTHRSTINLVKKQDGKQGLIFPVKNGLYNKDDVENMKRLLSSNELYTIQLTATTGNHTSRAIISSLPSCQLQKSGFKEDILVYMDSSDNIVGVSYSSPVGTIARECSAKQVKDQINFQTRIKLGDTVAVQSIPLQSIGPRPAALQDKNLGTADDAEIKPKQQSFLQRYWYIVVIMIIYMLLGGGGAEPAKDGAAGPAAAATAAPSAK